MTGTEGLDPATTAVLGLLGIQTLTALIQAVFGGNGERGLKERVAVLESDVKHVIRDTRDIKGALGILHRDMDKDKY